MQIVSTWEREEIHLNNNEETLIEDSLAQGLLCNLFTIPWDRPYKLFHIAPLSFF